MSSLDLARWGGLASMLAGGAFIVLLLTPVVFMVLKLHPNAIARVLLMSLLVN